MPPACERLAGTRGTDGRSRRNRAGTGFGPLADCPRGALGDGRLGVPHPRIHRRRVDADVDGAARRVNPDLALGRPSWRAPRKPDGGVDPGQAGTARSLVRSRVRRGRARRRRLPRHAGAGANRPQVRVLDCPDSTVDRRHRLRRHRARDRGRAADSGHRHGDPRPAHARRLCDRRVARPDEPAVGCWLATLPPPVARVRRGLRGVPGLRDPVTHPICRSRAGGPPVHGHRHRHQRGRVNPPHLLPECVRRGSLDRLVAGWRRSVEARGPRPDGDLAGGRPGRFDRARRGASGGGHGRSW